MLDKGNLVILRLHWHIELSCTHKQKQKEKRTSLSNEAFQIILLADGFKTKLVPRMWKVPLFRPHHSNIKIFRESLFLGVVDSLYLGCIESFIGCFLSIHSLPFCINVHIFRYQNIKIVRYIKVLYIFLGVIFLAKLKPCVEYLRIIIMGFAQSQEYHTENL